MTNPNALPMISNSIAAVNSPLVANDTTVPFQNWAGESLQNANLRGYDLSGANLVNTNFQGADLRGAILKGANLTGAILSGADLRGATLNHAVLTNAILSGAILGGADLSGAILRGAKLWDANMSGAILIRADLKTAKLSGSILCGANLKETTLNHADLRSAKLDRATLWGANLSGTNLTNTSLVGVDLSSVDLTGANLWGANLSRADLSCTIVEYTRFGSNPGLSDSEQEDLKQRGAIFVKAVSVSPGATPSANRRSSVTSLPNPILVKTGLPQDKLATPTPKPSQAQTVQPTQSIGKLGGETTFMQSPITAIQPPSEQPAVAQAEPVDEEEHKPWSEAIAPEQYLPPSVRKAIEIRKRQAKSQAKAGDYVAEMKHFLTKPRHFL